MSLFGKIAALFSGGNSSARNVCVVDGDRMVGGDRIGPGERFQTLSKLSRFAGREKMDVRVVFGGRPLREAPDGADFNGVKVYYGETEDEVQKLLKKQLGSVGRSNACLVTSDQKIENDSIGSGYSTMRVSTLRKAMEAGSSEGGNGNRDSGRRSSRGGRGRSRRPGDARSGKPNRGPRDQENQNRPAENNESTGGGNDSVKNLIDLVE